MRVCSGCGTELPAQARFCFQCGAAIAAREDQDPLLGTAVGAYHILSVLGEGGMGKVYLAQQTSLGRTVCVKTLLPHLTGDANLVRRFEREARSASALNHPNIVGVLDFGRTGSGLLYLAMEFVEGGRSLREVIQQEAPLSLERVSRLAGQILSALAEAHGAGVVHRDLKPENVLMARLRDGDDLAKVADFGLAVLTDAGGDSRLTATGMICGTPGYMAPEQITGDPVDAATDVYAAGVVLYELLTGRAPLGGTSLQDMLRRHLEEVPQAPSRVSPLPIPPAIDALVLRALEKRRDLRYGSALELKRDLEAAVRTSTRRPEPLELASLPGTRASGEGAALAGESLDSLRRLMPSKLVEHIDDLRHLLAGERRNVAVLFGDISGFTAMSESMEPEQVRDLMNRCFDGMVEAVERYDGTVDKFIGDAIMVLFGAPTAHEDDAERAVRCGLDMLAALEAVNRTLSHPLGMRIGINVGEVVAGGVGGQRRMDYTVMGDVVNTAQRLESAARVGTILVSASVHRLTQEAFEYRALEPIAVKGKREALEVFEVAGLQAAEATAREPLVGRRGELARIEGLLDEAARGASRCLLLLGDPGLGKSRLLAETVGLAKARGFTVTTARGGRLGVEGHLDVIRQSIFSLCGGVPDEPGLADQRLSGLGSSGVDAVSVHRLRHLFGSAPALGGFEAQENLLLDRAAVLAPLVQAAQGAGLCVVVDDLHLADEASRGVLADLVARAPESRLVVVAAARPSASEVLLPQAMHVQLGPLGLPEVLEVARIQAAGGALPLEIAELVGERADGNPFVARELVRTLIERGAMRLSAGRWSTAAGFDPGLVPDRVAQLVTARIDALRPASRALLRYGAVAGRVFPIELVAAAAGGEAEVAAALPECLNRGLLVPAQEAGSWQFQQAIVRETLLRGLTAADRKHLHLRLAEALERGASPGTTSPVEAIAHHFLAAEQARKALRYVAAAGEHLFERGAYEDAAERFRVALELGLAQIRRASNVDERGAAHLLHLAGRRIASLNMSAPERALDVLEAVLAELPPGLAVNAHADALREVGLCFLRLGRVREAETRLREALALVLPQRAPEVTARIHGDLAQALEARGDLPGAAQHLVDGFKWLAGGNTVDRDVLWRYLNQLGRVHLRLKQLPRARDFLENARMQARRAESVVGEARVVTNLASLLAVEGDLGAAAGLFREALELATRGGDRIGVARVHYNLGRLMAATGRPAEALGWLDTAIRLSEALGWREGLSAALQARNALTPGGSAAR